MPDSCQARSGSLFRFVELHSSDDCFTVISHVAGAGDVERRISSSAPP